MQRHGGRFSEEDGCLPRKAQSALAFKLKEEGYKLTDVLKIVGIPESTYDYQMKQARREAFNREWKEKIYEIFHEHKGRYFYRRVYDELRNQGYIINRKKVQSSMG